MKTCILNPQKLNNNNIMLIDEYKALTSRNDFYSDKAQLEAINFFEQIYSNISGEKKSLSHIAVPSNRHFNFFTQKLTIFQGLDKLL